MSNYIFGNIVTFGTPANYAPLRSTAPRNVIHRTNHAMPAQRDTIVRGLLQGISTHYKAGLTSNFYLIYYITKTALPCQNTAFL